MFHVKERRLLCAITNCRCYFAVFAALCDDVRVRGNNAARRGRGQNRPRKSPRHGEFVYVPLPGSDTKIKTWVVYPEVKDKAPVVPSSTKSLA